MGEARRRQPDEAKRVAEAQERTSKAQAEKNRLRAIEDAKPENIARRKKVNTILAFAAGVTIGNR